MSVVPAALPMHAHSLIVPDAMVVGAPDQLQVPSVQTASFAKPDIERVLTDSSSQCGFFIVLLLLSIASFPLSFINCSTSSGNNVCDVDEVLSSAAVISSVVSGLGALAFCDYQSNKIAFRKAANIFQNNSPKLLSFRLPSFLAPQQSKSGDDGFIVPFRLPDVSSIFRDRRDGEESIWEKISGFLTPPKPEEKEDTVEEQSSPSLFTNTYNAVKGALNPLMKLFTRESQENSDNGMNKYELEGLQAFIAAQKL